MDDNKQDRSPAEGQSQGQEGIDRETEQRNRENEAGQQRGEQAGKQGESAFGQQGQSAGGGFVGASGDKSSDYLTKGEANQDLAPEGQGDQDSDPGRADIETGQPRDEARRNEDPAPDGK